MSAEGEEQSAASYDSRCIFCRISNNQEPDCQLLHSDEDLACFRDIRPGAPHHYLVVPKKHIGNCKTLTNDHVPLVMSMIEVGKNVLQKNHVTDLEDIRLTNSLSVFKQTQPQAEISFASYSWISSQKGGSPLEH
ncbi:adenosine 5'-monophosphoramidase HINT3 isoform 2-T2 [Mantella aurantiaca]